MLFETVAVSLLVFRCPHYLWLVAWPLLPCMSHSWSHSHTYVFDILLHRFSRKRETTSHSLALRERIWVSACLAALHYLNVSTASSQAKMFHAGTGTTHAFLTIQISLGGCMEKKRKLLRCNGWWFKPRPDLVLSVRFQINQSNKLTQIVLACDVPHNLRR